MARFVPFPIRSVTVAPETGTLPAVGSKTVPNRRTRDVFSKTASSSCQMAQMFRSSPRPFCEKLTVPGCYVYIKHAYFEAVQPCGSEGGQRVGKLWKHNIAPCRRGFDIVGIALRIIACSIRKLDLDPVRSRSASDHDHSNVGAADPALMIARSEGIAGHALKSRLWSPSVPETCIRKSADSGVPSLF